MIKMDQRHVVAFAAGVVATAVLWWITELMLDKHIGPLVGKR